MTADPLLPVCLHRWFSVVSVASADSPDPPWRKQVCVDCGAGRAGNNLPPDDSEKVEWEAGGFVVVMMRDAR